MVELGLIRGEAWATIGDFLLLASVLNPLGIVLPNVVRVLLGSLGSDVAKMKHF